MPPCLRNTTLLVGLALVILATGARADIPSDGDAWLLSARIGVPALSNSLAAAESLAKSYHFDLAAQELGKAIAAPEAGAFLDQEIHQCGPVRLCLEPVRLFYFMKAARRGTDEIAAQCRSLLDQYATNAAGKDWHAYELLFVPIIENAQRAKDGQTMLDSYERLVQYDPWNAQHANYYMFTILGEGRATSNSMAILDAPWLPQRLTDAGYQLLKCKVRRIAGLDAFGPLLVWMRQFPQCDMGRLHEALDMGAELVNENPAQRQRRYVVALTNLALAQPPDRMDFLAYILAERGKWQPADTTFAPLTTTDRGSR